MGKRKKHSTEIQASPSHTQSVMKLQEKTSPTHVSAHFEEATKNTNTEATQNISGRAHPEFMPLTAQVKFSSLTQTTKSQTTNDPLQKNSTQSYHLGHKNAKCMSKASFVKQYSKEQNADKQHMNACNISAKTQEKIISIQTESLPSVMPMTEITNTTNKSEESEPAVKAIQHLADQQNGAVASFHRETPINLDLESTSKNRLSPVNESQAAAASQTDVQEEPFVLMVTKQPSKTYTPNLAKTTSTTNDFSKKQTFTEEGEITEKLYGSEVPHLCVANNMVHFGTDNTQPIRELHKESNIGRCLMSISALPLQKNESFSETTTEDITGSEIYVINQKHASPAVSIAKLQTKSDIFQNVGINVDLTVSTKEAGVSIGTSQSSPTSSGCPTQKSASSFSQDTKAAELGNEVPTLSLKTKTVLCSLSTEDSDISTTNHKNKIEVYKEVLVLPLATKALQDISSSTSQSTNASLRCLKKSSKSSLSLAVRAAKLSTEGSTHLSTMKCGASTKHHVRTSTLQPTKKLMSNTSHEDKVSELDEVPILPSTTNVEGDDEVYFSSNKEEKEVLSVVRNNNTTASSEGKRDDNNDGQNPDMKLDVKKDGAVRNCLTNFTKRSRSKRMPISCGETLDSNEKQEKNKGRSTSHICVSNHLSDNKGCKMTILKYRTADTQKSLETSGSINNDKDEKFKIIKKDRKASNTILFSEESCRRPRKPMKNKDTQIDMNPESLKRQKQNCCTQSNMKNLTTGLTSQKNSSSRNTNVKCGKSDKNTQNSCTDLLVKAHNEAVLNDPALQKKINSEKETAKEGKKADIQGEEYAESETCDHKTENILSWMDPETVRGKVKHNEDSKSADSLTMMLKKEGPNETILNYSIQNNKIVSCELRKGQLSHLTKTTACVCPSPEDSDRSKTTFIPDSIPVSTADEAELEYRLVQRHIFLYYVCHVCKSLDSPKFKLKKCNNCKMISYCSKEHQREHWTAHKDLCKVISKICKSNKMTNLFEKALGISPDQYRYYRSHYINECTKELGRELHLWEKEMIYYPEVCHTCYESDRKKLTSCPKCHHVSYCQLSHLKHDHDIWCKEFQVYRDIILYQCYHGIIQPSIPDMVLQQYTPLTGEMKTFMLNKNTVSEKLLSLNRLNFVTLTDIATCPLTVLFCLQHCNFCLDKIKSLTIHLVGAEMQFEVNSLQKWDLLLLHLVPSLRILKVVFVGPQLETEDAYIWTMGKNKTCNKCNSKGRKVSYELWKTLYHDYLKCDAYHKPDFIFAFNAGLYRLSDFEEKDTWSPSIEAMFKEPDIPVAITEYTDKELPFDIQRIQNIVGSLEIVMPPAINPFASLKPSLNFLSEETIPVIFKNFHITILKREKI